MARARNIKPSIMDNEELAELEPVARLLFIYLWMLADREGRLEDRPKRIAAQALPYDRDVDVGAMLDALHKAGFIIRYQAQGVACIQITAFLKHQSPHMRESDSALPRMDVVSAQASPENTEGTTKALPRHNLGNAEASPRFSDCLIPSSLIPDTGLGTSRDARPSPGIEPELDEQGQTPSRRSKTAKTGKARPGKTRLPDDFAMSDRVREWAQSRGYDRLDEHLDAFRRKCVAKGYTYASWDDALMEAIREDWAKLRSRANGNGQRAVSFAQQDELDRRRRWEEMTGRTWPADPGFCPPLLPGETLEPNILEIVP